MGVAWVGGDAAMGSWREHAFSQDDLSFLEQIARQVAIALPSRATARSRRSRIQQQTATIPVLLEAAQQPGQPRLLSRQAEHAYGFSRDPVSEKRAPNAGAST